MQQYIQKDGKRALTYYEKAAKNKFYHAYGADLEAVVKDTIERAFIDGRTTITTADLIRSIKDTKSISCTLKDKIASIQKTVEKIDIKPASLDDKKEKEPDPHRCI